MYDTGYCPSDADGNPLPCPRGYGAIIGTAALCALIEIGMSFAPAKVLKKVGGTSVGRLAESSLISNRSSLHL